MKSALENSTANFSRTFNTPSERLLAAYIVLSLFAVLYIPYFFPVPPVPQPLTPIFGCNNRIGSAHYTLTVAATAQNLQYELWTPKP